MSSLRVAWVCSWAAVALGRFDIESFGAVSTSQQPDVAIANLNAKAITLALKHANEDNSGDRTAYISNKTYYFTAVAFDYLFNMTFQIDGRLVAHNRISQWPVGSNGKALQEFYFRYADTVTITGNGTVDGQGYNWWWWSISCGLPNATHKDTRSHMLHFFQSRNLLVEGIHMVDSPLYHLYLEDVDTVTVRNFEIFVNVTRQKSILRHFGFFDDVYGIPTFPLNTDGIDPKASNVLIHDGSITNFDDGVAFKPCRNDSAVCRSCSGGVVQNLRTEFTVGMSIGSVPPNPSVNCIRDVTFRNIDMKYPLKGVYIKSNPGSNGVGIIDNILYENIVMDGAVWWPLWIGPQQMSQPDGTYLGCDMRYPFNSTICPTNPLVSISNIQLRNVSSHRALNPYPGVILCDVANPCTKFAFENVHFTEGANDRPYKLEYITEYVDGTVTDSTPIPAFL